jgi:hypothetical protein
VPNHSAGAAAGKSTHVIRSAAPFKGFGEEAVAFSVVLVGATFIGRLGHGAIGWRRYPDYVLAHYRPLHKSDGDALEPVAGTRTMQAYKAIIGENTTLFLSTGSDLFKFLKGMAPDGDVVPAPPSSGSR